MSQYPYQNPNPYDQTLPYAVPGNFNAPKRPTAITVMAILGICFGALGLAGSCWGVANSAMALSNGGRNPMLATSPAMDPIVGQIGIAQSAVGLVFNGVMLVACIAALKLRPAARVTMIWWSLLTIVHVIISTIVSVIWVLPATAKALQGIGGPQGQAAASMFASIGMVTVIGGALFSLVLPILYLALWTRPSVKAAFGVA